MRLEEPPDRGNRIVDGNARILTIDIETIFGLARAFDQKTTFIPHGKFVTVPRMICFAARWYDKKTPIFKSDWTNRDDMITSAWKLYDQADIVVTYNGKRFDNKHLAREWLLADLPPPRPWKDVDLFPIVKSRFAFLSNSLDHVTKQLGRGGKSLHYDMDIAQAAVDGSQTAQRTLRTYNIGDIELTEWLYDRLRPWIHNHPHLGTFGDEARCNACGSDNLKLQPTKYRAVVIDYALYRCNHCGGNVRGGWHSRAASTRGVR